MNLGKPGDYLYSTHDSEWGVNIISSVPLDLKLCRETMIALAEAMSEVECHDLLVAKVIVSQEDLTITFVAFPDSHKMSLVRPGSSTLKICYECQARYRKTHPGTDCQVAVVQSVLDS